MRNPVSHSETCGRADASPYHVQVLDRALRLVDFLAAHPDLGPAEIAAQLSLHKSTVHRLLAVLERHHIVARRNGGKYCLGLKLFELGAAALGQLDLREQAGPVLRRLVAETGETAHICVPDQGEMLSVANAESPRSLRTPSTVGHRIPLHCTSAGKAYLASLPGEELETWLPARPFKAHTARTITTMSALKAELARVARRGYAVDNEEIGEGMRCVEAPVRDCSGRVVASISIARAAFRLSDERLPSLGRAVMRAAERLSAQLGYRGGFPARRPRGTKKM